MRKIQVQVAGVSTLVTEDKLTQIEDSNNYYKHYNADMSLDVLTIDTEAEAVLVEEAKQAKKEALDTLQVTNNTVAYDADGNSIGNMSAVIGIANFKFNQVVAAGINPADAYDSIYKETQIYWKGADNKPHQVMIESVAEALEASMLEVSNILGL